MHEHICPVARMEFFFLLLCAIYEAMNWKLEIIRCLLWLENCIWATVFFFQFYFRNRQSKFGNHVIFQFSNEPHSHVASESSSGGYTNNECVISDSEYCTRNFFGTNGKYIIKNPTVFYLIVVWRADDFVAGQTWPYRHVFVCEFLFFPRIGCCWFVWCWRALYCQPSTSASVPFLCHWFLQFERNLIWQVYCYA